MSADLFPAAPSPEPLGPVAGRQRLAAVDLLRGVALLGILMVNIFAFAMPPVVYRNPLLWGGFEGLDRATWVFTHVFFEQKFITLFSLLFGAGLVLLERRAAATGSGTGKIFVRRQLWLLVFGALHGYLLWFGDILFQYALCGLLAYPFRRLAPRFLLTVGTLVLLVALPLSTHSGQELAQLQTTAAAAEARLAAGETLTSEEEEALETWEQRRQFADPTEEDIAKTVAAYGDGSYWDIVKLRAPQVFAMQTRRARNVWRVLGMMLIGMALAKLGVITGERSAAFYRRCVGVGYGVGLPLVAWSAWDLVRHRFDAIYVSQIGSYWNYLGSLFVALGHLGVVMLLYQAGVGAWLQERLIAVGRMAFTNYLLHSLLLTTVFYGYGLGLFGRIDRFALLGFVLAVWLLQLGLSPVWLRHFRFGPAEWLWRSLTYGQRQPMRRTPPAAL